MPLLVRSSQLGWVTRLEASLMRVLSRIAVEMISSRPIRAGSVLMLAHRAVVRMLYVRVITLFSMNTWVSMRRFVLLRFSRVRVVMTMMIIMLLMIMTMGRRLVVMMLIILIMLDMTLLMVRMLMTTRFQLMVVMMMLNMVILYNLPVLLMVTIVIVPMTRFKVRILLMSPKSGRRE